MALAHSTRASQGLRTQHHPQHPLLLSPRLLPAPARRVVARADSPSSPLTSFIYSKGPGLPEVTKDTFHDYLASVVDKVVVVEFYTGGKETSTPLCRLALMHHQSSSPSSSHPSLASVSVSLTWPIITSSPINSPLGKDSHLVAKSASTQCLPHHAKV